MIRLLVTGAGGMVGREVVEAARGRGWDVVGLGRAELDVTDRAAVLATVAAVRADAVLNAAAYTRVDEAEADAEMARRLRHHLRLAAGAPCPLAR